MKLVIQRVSQASVTVDGATVVSIRTGLVALVGIAQFDTENDADYLSGKVIGLRVFPDKNGKMNLNVSEANGSILIVSQFTLYGDCRKGRRPSFDRAALPEQALPLYNYFVDKVRRSSVPVETGIFQAMMEVLLVNQGPVTVLIDSEERNRT
jgi:D-aminoacyl-tRNA deacylase